MESHSPLSFSTCPDSGKTSPYRASTACPVQNFIPAPLVTAASWSLTNAETGECLWGKSKDTVRDIASLTKMMTLYVVKQCIRQRIITDLDVATVPREATLLGGTTAYLRTNDTLKIIDLLYAMMLPSGNDAAFTLADYCGGRMLNDPRFNRKKAVIGNVEFFVKQMNIWCKHMGMKNTLFLNPHGLSHLGNHSTAAEIGKLGAWLINRPLVAEIVSSIKYSCDVKNGNSTRKLTWVNTNLLLGKPGVTGLKTGQTPTAGPCLCVTFTVSGYKLAVTLLKCRTAEKRWAEATKLVEWAVTQLDIIFQKYTDKNIRTRNLANFINSIE
ncbi:hypothetical protein SteCoe_3683 [Stentor coeruleus]|uniref:Peptidase S11 D-alanyl-D-alanine carboxypeptidase A N-terminal domain-containing protein n=1 Tax=Stentor coeruleus TaxID=5963 RepID=A0A1R2CWJ4_9CILI|nr:hypothetical protein SteCoe_3683 [Stentor coeruleus]